MARRRTGHSRDSKHYDKWLDKAGEDMTAASVLLGDSRCFVAAAFHCHQAIEKALKAYLLLKTNHLNDGHNLTWLCKQAKKHDKVFDGWIEESTHLNRAYIEARYPTDLPLNYDESYVRKVFHMAGEMFIFICEEVDKVLEE